ncbi:MAG: antibiotic biosynthesis monooxygenase [Anaerolineae bacterium]|jgi:quinol monooxygenase YgiN|nr:antibiotic biosynthesis monooxygenase [Anaerolineae bacterium]
MITLVVQFVIKPVYLDTVVRAILENARSSREEPGNLRFDVMQDEEDPFKFTLVEVYRDEEAFKAHFESEHFKKWREVTADAMVERLGKRQKLLFPEVIT